MKRKRMGGFIISKIHQISGRIFAKILKMNNITEINPAQGRILFVLWQNDGLPITELSRKTQLEKSTLTSMLDRLEKDGYLERVSSSEDRRKIIIKRTDKDKNLQMIYNKISDEMTGYFYENFSDSEIDIFENSLQKILDNLLKYEEANGNVKILK